MQNANELYHYGRLGMRWGRHIYQNRYGEINQAGRKKVRELETEYDRLAKSNTLNKQGLKRKSDIEKEYENLTGKSVGSRKELKKIQDMSNEELQAHNLRKQLETQATSGLPKPSVAVPSNKKVSDMTNDELQAYNTRKQLEETYLKFQPKPRTSKGKQFVGAVLTKVVAPVAVDYGKAYLKDTLKNMDLTAKAAKAAEAAAKEAAKEAAEAAAKAVLK